MAANLGWIYGGWNRWLTLGMVGLVAIVGGTTLPGMLPAESPAALPAVGLDKAAAGKLQYTPPRWPEPPDTRGMLLKLGLATAIVLGLCLTTLWVGKRWLGSPPARPGVSGQLQLVETLPLGQGCRLLLVQAGTGRVLVGVDSTGLKAVLTLAEPFESTLVAEQAENTGAA